MAEFGLKLRYFPARARGESIRMLLRHKQIPFEDIVIRGPEFAKMKPELPTGQLPVLEVNGRNYPESGSQLRFIGQITSTIPTDPVKFFAADATYEVARGLSLIEPIINRFEGDVLTEQYKNYFENQLPPRLTYLSKTLADRPFFGGDVACYADFGIWPYLDNTETVKPNSVTHTNLKDWMQRFAALVEVKKYLDERLEIREERRLVIEQLQSTQ